MPRWNWPASNLLLFSEKESIARKGPWRKYKGEKLEARGKTFRLAGNRRKEERNTDRTITWITLRFSSSLKFSWKRRWRGRGKRKRMMRARGGLKIWQWFKLTPIATSAGKQPGKQSVFSAVLAKFHLPRHFPLARRKFIGPASSRGNEIPWNDAPFRIQNRFVRIVQYSIRITNRNYVFPTNEGINFSVTRECSAEKGKKIPAFIKQSRAKVVNSWQRIL